jgi:hypothetical protein
MWPKEEILPRGGSTERIRLMSGMNPMSSIRSASSSTRNSTRDRVDGLLVQVVEQAPRRGDHDFRPACKHLDLRVDVHSAEDERGAQRQVLAVDAHAFLDLRGELARRRENQHARRVARRRQAGIGLGRENCSKAA